jgi:carotenoid cleavage dioxygenase-like enzyme
VLDDVFGALGVRLPTTGLRRTAVPVDARWLGGVENAREVSGAAVVALEGAVPRGLRGTLLRNGPGRFDRGGERVPHWFDGDGGILRVSLDGGAEPTMDYRFVRGEAFVDDEAAGRFTHPAFGYLPEGSPARRSLLRAKNPANTHVVAFGDRLLALYEGARPTALDRQTLATLGEVDLGRLGKSECFTAHPHTDADGRTFGFTYQPGPGGGASVVELDAAGEIVRKVPLPALKAPPHDFISAGPFLVFLESPTVTNALPALVGMRAIGDEIGWNARGKTRIHVLDKNSLDLIVTGSAPPLSSAHFGGGRLEDDGTISFVAFVPDDNDPSGQAMARFARGERTDVGGRPTRIHVDPKSGDIVRRVVLADERAEWPAEDPRAAGDGGQALWCATQSSTGGYFDGYARLDREKGFVDRIALRDGVFGNEPIVSVDADDPSRRWLVTVQYDSRADRSELVVYDADALAAGPHYRGALADVVPFGFHGSFVPATT